MSDLDNEELEATKKLQEKSADELFEELEYEKIHDMRYYNFNLHKDIFFADLYIEIAFGELSMRELKAINKKVSELGWL